MDAVVEIARHNLVEIRDSQLREAERYEEALATTGMNPDAERFWMGLPRAEQIARCRRGADSISWRLASLG